MDPCEREERVKDGLLVIAMNKHREICSIQSSGGIMLLKDQVRVYVSYIFLVLFYLFLVYFIDLSHNCEMGF